MTADERAFRRRMLAAGRVHDVGCRQFVWRSAADLELSGFVAGDTTPAVLAVGADMKNSVCLLFRGRAVLSGRLGELTDAGAYRHFLDTIDRLAKLYDFHPQLLAADMHPGYVSTQFAERWRRGHLPGRAGLPLVHVQHHHAHVAACLAENGREGPVIGLACDGTGYGDDGAVWGCEIVEADLHDYRRLGHLRYMRLIGGDAAAVETWRPALAALYDTFGTDCIARMTVSRSAQGRERPADAMEMIKGGANCPESSSLGRWFDAAAYLSGVAGANRFEGEAPMKLESAVEEGIEEAYPFRIEEGRPFLIDLRPMVVELCRDLEKGVNTGEVAAKFHNTVVRFLLAAAVRARSETGRNVVALSGGCFANRYLTGRLAAALEGERFEVILHREIPCNDGGVGLGQAVVAATRHQRRQSAVSVERPADF